MGQISMIFKHFSDYFLWLVYF